jgi:hypothetical protein
VWRRWLISVHGCGGFWCSSDNTLCVDMPLS